MSPPEITCMVSPNNSVSCVCDQALCARKWERVSILFVLACIYIITKIERDANFEENSKFGDTYTKTGSSPLVIFECTRLLRKAFKLLEYLNQET